MLHQLLVAVVTTVKTTGVNWNAVAALSTPTILIVGGVGRILSSKLNSISAHLERQDARGRRLDRRMGRVEDHLGLPSLPRDDDD
jgi:hypothetical protein